jgi:hypothetical protein
LALSILAHIEGLIATSRMFNANANWSHSFTIHGWGSDLVRFTLRLPRTPVFVAYSTTSLRKSTGPARAWIFNSIQKNL